MYSAACLLNPSNCPGRTVVCALTSKLAMSPPLGLRSSDNSGLPESHHSSSPKMRKARSRCRIFWRVACTKRSESRYSDRRAGCSLQRTLELPRRGILGSDPRTRRRGSQCSASPFFRREDLHECANGTASFAQALCAHAGVRKDHGECGDETRLLRARIRPHSQENPNKRLRKTIGKFQSNVSIGDFRTSQSRPEDRGLVPAVQVREIDDT